MRILLVALLITVASFSRAETIVPGGNVSGDWTSEGSPYVIQGNISVPDDLSLTIHDGVIVSFEGNHRLWIYGHFHVNGTVDSPVTFTTDTLANPEWWDGIQVNSSNVDTCFLNYLIVEYVKNGSSGYGALNFTGGTRAVLDHVIARNNICQGIFAEQQARLDIYECLLEHNGLRAGGGFGGGITSWDQADVYIYDSIIRFNHMLDGGGFEANGNNFSMYNCEVSDNWATLWGGAAVIGSENFFASHCTFRGNSGNQGGAVFVSGAETAGRFDYCVFESNTGVTGGAYWIYNSDVSIESCTFYNNSANEGAAFSTNVPVEVNNCIFSNQSGPELFYLGAEGTSLTFCNFFNNAGEFITGIPNPEFAVLNRINNNGDSCDVYFNIFLDPIFADAPTGDLHLTANSPCIDAGDPELGLDPDNTVADIGAFYFDQGISAVDPLRAPFPESLILKPAYPNPFNPTTTISFELPIATSVKLSVFDITGRVLAELINGVQSAGSHSITWNASSYSSGIYFVSLASVNGVSVQKLVLLK